METELRKKIKYLDELVKNYDLFSALVSAMKKAEKQGLEMDKQILINAIKQQDKIEKIIKGMLS